MRIGIDATALPPQPVGAGQYIIQLIRALAALDHSHEILVFALQHGRTLIDVPERPGLQWVVFPDQAPPSRLVWEQVSLPRLAGRLGLDLLHSPHYTRPLGLRRFAPRCKSVVTFHDLTFFLFPHLHTRAKRLFFPAAMRLSARQADALIAVSESTRQDAIRILKLDPQRIFTVPLGVDASFRPVTDRFLREEIRRRYRLPERFLLYVGLVEPRKNLPLLIRTYARLQREAGAPPPLVIVGRMGWMYEEVLQQIADLGLKERVHFTGYVSPQDLPIVYNLADVFVYPSLYEGFGLPPLEAMACGTPVVTTAVSSMPEHVGQAGILVPPADEPALAQALRTVLEDSAQGAALRRELATKGPQQAAHFSWKRTAQATLQVYEAVLSQDRTAVQRPANTRQA